MCAVGKHVVGKRERVERTLGDSALLPPEPEPEPGPVLLLRQVECSFERDAGESGFEGDGRGGYGAGGERMAMADWKMLMRSRQKRDNSRGWRSLSALVGMGGTARTGDSEALFP